MSKRKTCDKDLDLLDKLKHENKQLKGKIALLRKQIDRLDMDGQRYNELRALASQQYEEEKKTIRAKKLREKWRCYDCGTGVLKITIVSRRDGEHYFRSCSHCSKRTSMKKYTQDVQGVK